MDEVAIWDAVGGLSSFGHAGREAHAARGADIGRKKCLMDEVAADYAKRIARSFGYR